MHIKYNNKAIFIFIFTLAPYYTNSHRIYIYVKFFLENFLFFNISQKNILEFLLENATNLTYFFNLYLILPSIY